MAGMERWEAAVNRLIVTDDPLGFDVGRRVRFSAPRCPAEQDDFTIIATQRICDNSIAYRVVGDAEQIKAGRPARPEEVYFIEEGAFFIDA